MPRIVGDVRRSQVISTYGVGAIVAVEDGAFMVAGLHRWPPGPPDLFEPRLQRKLEVEGFRRPPASDGQPLPVVRFPEVHYCPTCRRLDEARYLTSSVSAKFECSACHTALVPSRFVIACENGHVDDFPYCEWVHQGEPNPPCGKADHGTHSLTLKTGGVTASLADITIECSCGRRATMDDTFGSKALMGIVRGCSGRQPWLGKRENCGLTPRTLQRGASSVWFAVLESALSIPPWSEGASRLLDPHWPTIRRVQDDAVIAAIIEANGLLYDHYSLQELLAAAAYRRRWDGGGPPADLRPDEYAALSAGRPATPNAEFICVPSGVPPRLEGTLRKVMRAERLREVRVLKSFTRVHPPSPPNLAGAAASRLASLTAGAVDWLPAIEILGEGIFIDLDPELIEAWEFRDEVQARVGVLDKRYAARFTGLGTAADRRITPRLVAVHTLAHALISQWALESGYPSAALRERLFVGPDMAGLLIYTATSDSAGSMGGVTALARPERLEPAFTEAISRAAWCSADPVCIESMSGGVDGLNLAACHACALLPEVSCEEFNSLLDRALLVGTPENPSLGLFSALL